MYFCIIQTRCPLDSYVCWTIFVTQLFPPNSIGQRELLAKKAHELCCYKYYQYKISKQTLSLTYTNRTHQVSPSKYAISACGVNIHTTLLSIMNAKPSQHMFWHFHENEHIKMILAISHNLYVSVKSSSLC